MSFPAARYGLPQVGGFRENRFVGRSANGGYNHTNEMLGMLYAASDFFEPDADARVGVLRTNVVSFPSDLALRITR